MSIDITLAKLTLPILTILAITGTFLLSYNNGFLAQLQAYQAATSPYLPDSRYALKNHWTGVGPVDRLCVQFIAFFWPVLNGLNPSLSLQGVHFLGQGYAVWTLVLVEGWREGNRGKVVALVTLTGLLMENLLLALTLPMYFLLHLFTSPTVKADMPAGLRAHSLSIDPVVLNFIPYSVLIGAGIPTLGALLSPLGSTQQQTFLVIRQIHPVLATLALYTLTFLTTRLITKSRTTEVIPSTTSRNRALLHSLNRAYTFATFLSTTTHLATMTLILTSQLTRTVLRTGYTAYFSPSAVFAPPPLFSPPSHSPASTPTFASGAHVFLKYDELFSCAALLVWAIAANRVALLQGDEAGWAWAVKRLATWEYWRVQNKVLFWLAVGGPAAAAVQLVRERDEWVLGGEGAEEENESESEGRGERPYVDD